MSWNFKIVLKNFFHCAQARRHSMICLCKVPLKCQWSRNWLRCLSWTQGVSELPDFIQFKPHAAVPLDSVFSAVGSDALEMLGRTLALNPLRRCTATEVYISLHFSPFFFHFAVFVTFLQCLATLDDFNKKIHLSSECKLISWTDWSLSELWSNVVTTLDQSSDRNQSKMWSKNQSETWYCCSNSWLIFSSPFICRTARAMLPAVSIAILFVYVWVQWDQR